MYKFANNQYFYKTFRFTNNKKWKFSSLNVYDVALSKENMNDYSEKKNKHIMRTCLKAFEGAPVFTVEELAIWERIFAEYGLIRKGKKIPKKDLTCRMIVYHNPEFAHFMRKR